MRLLKRFPEYKASIIKLMFEGAWVNNVTAWERTQVDLEDQAPSRASVINFMAELETSGFLEYKEKTGKGGIHREYKLAMNKEEALEKLGADLLTEFTAEVLKKLM